MACLGAVNLSTGRRVTSFRPVFNGETFEAFVRRLLRPSAYRHARSLRPLLHKHRRHRSLFFLPPYSPRLSTIERVWKLTRRLATHNRYFPTLPAVLEAVTACFRRWQKPNETRRRLCCFTQEAVFSGASSRPGTWWSARRMSRV
ncbi:MAG: transposase [Betaproteobacteria bacterium]